MPHSLVIGKPFPKRQILDSFKLKEFADDNFKLDGNGRKLSKRVENTVGKGGIARYSVFKRLVSQGHQKVSLYGNGLNSDYINKDYIITISKSHFFRFNNHPCCRGSNQ